MEAPIPVDEDRRLQALADCRILDTLPEPCFDHIVGLAANACDTPIALFSLVDESRQWFKARVGLDAQETARDVSFCAHAVASDELLVVEDARKDPRFLGNALVLDKPNIRFYAGVPVHARVGQPLGTLCVIDQRPRTLSASGRAILKGLAREIEAQLDIRRIAGQQRDLLEERAVMSSMIVHDVRGVLQALGWDLELLEQRLGEEVEPLVQARQAVAELKQLLRGIAAMDERQSRGLQATLRNSQLGAWFDSIAARARTAAAHAGMKLTASCDARDATIETDTDLLDRVIRNLYDNAIRACSAGATISLYARSRPDDRIELGVEDDGPGIADEDAKRIFEPYFSQHESSPPGTGLGLAFCRLAAAALGGTVEYIPRKPKGARFVIDLPGANAIQSMATAEPA